MRNALGPLDDIGASGGHGQDLNLRSRNGDVVTYPGYPTLGLTLPYVPLKVGRS